MKTSEVFNHPLFKNHKSLIGPSIGLSAAVVYNWGDEPPMLHQIALEQMTVEQYGKGSDLILKTSGKPWQSEKMKKAICTAAKSSESVTRLINGCAG